MWCSTLFVSEPKDQAHAPKVSTATVSANPVGTPGWKRTASQASCLGKRRSSQRARRLRETRLTCRPAQLSGSRADRSRCPRTSASTTTANRAMPTWVA